MKKLFLLVILMLFFSVNGYSQRIILSEGFENGPYTVDSIPTGWAKIKVIGSSLCTDPQTADWRVRDSGSVFCQTNTVPSFTAKAYGNTRKSLSIPWTTSAGPVTDDWVFTKSLGIEAGDTLFFAIQLGTWPAGGTYYPDSLQVWVTSGQTPASQIAKLQTITSLPQASNTWQTFAFPLSAYAGQTIHVAFRYNMNVTVNGIMVNIDSVRVKNDNGIPVSVQNGNGNVPTTYKLQQNYPNPFNPATNISFDIPKNEFVNITVFNSLGQQVAVLVNEYKSAGSYSVNYNATGLPSGVYIYRMQAGQFTETMKMTLIK